MAEQSKPEQDPSNKGEAGERARGVGSKASTSRKSGDVVEPVITTRPDTAPVLPAGRDDVAYPGSAKRDDEPDESRSGGNVLNSSVHVRNPETGEVELLEAGTECPDWATEKRKIVEADGSEREEPLVGDHLLGEAADTQKDPSVDVPVPYDRENMIPGGNASRARWAAFASAHGVIVHRGATTEDIRDALDRAGVELS